jgi:hypothetical protein
MAIFFDSMTLDLSEWHLYVSDFKVEVNDGCQRLDVGMTSTMPNFEGYDLFIKDLTLLSKIKKQIQYDPAVKEAWDQLITVSALKS